VPGGFGGAGVLGFMGWKLLARCAQGYDGRGVGSSASAPKPVGSPTKKQACWWEGVGELSCRYPTVSAPAGAQAVLALQRNVSFQSLRGGDDGGI